VTPVLEFAVTHRSGDARAGEMTTAHGLVPTPAFMPVGTLAAVKGVLNRDLLETGASIILANTYHLMLRPGDDAIARLGGLHRFMGWSRPILTDSGGYQVFSLAARRQVSDEGVRFQSHLDGREYRLGPEEAVCIQARLGSDISMVLDECVAYPAAYEGAAAAVGRSALWGARARARFNRLASGDAAVTNAGQSQFGIVQGGVFPDLRTRSVEETLRLQFEGYAIGGLSVGEPPSVMYDVVAHTAAQLPADRPRYLMGTGTPVDLVESVARGVDLFDCVLPTRNARNGQLFTTEGPLNIKNARYAEDERRPDAGCSCYTCRHHSRAYLRHLFMARELAASTLNSLHNLHFYLDTMRRIREAIMFDRYEKFRQAFHQTYSRRA
jgi:queuine tRNA-ribosyltransferase